MNVLLRWALMKLSSAEHVDALLASGLGTFGGAFTLGTLCGVGARALSAQLATVLKSARAGAAAKVCGGAACCCRLRSRVKKAGARNGIEKAGAGDQKCDPTSTDDEEERRRPTTDVTENVRVFVRPSSSVVVVTWTPHIACARRVPCQTERAWAVREASRAQRRSHRLCFRSRSSHIARARYLARVSLCRTRRRWRRRNGAATRVPRNPRARRHAQRPRLTRFRLAVCAAGWRCRCACTPAGCLV